MDYLSYIEKETIPCILHRGQLNIRNGKSFDYVDNQTEKTILKETNGIGTVATRADILEKLFSNDYLFLDNGKIKTTNKGKNSYLIQQNSEKLKSPSLTATWEKALDNISKNKLSKEKFFIKY